MVLQPSFLAPMGVYWDLHYSEDFFDAELDKFYCSFKRIPLPYVFAEPFEAQLKQSMSEVKVQVLSYFHSVDDKAQLASYLQKSTFDDSITGDRKL